eukprot:TRINITY_DN516_c0_g1_i1.p1 TRINITY_DN516_c0_g1~~TRINITY_DN516_c0_g1_i1.p1  ORF type:complete len:471 (+),score=49.03 TRINITY_DN516_c0_g1_i1:101-1414(+)
MSLTGIQRIVDGLRRDDSIQLVNLFEQNAILPDQVILWNYPNQEKPVYRRTLLQVAAYCGSVGCMRTLLSRGAAVNCVSVDDGKTALDCALEGTSTRMLEAVRLLLENGATLDKNSPAGQVLPELTISHRQDSSDLTKPAYQTDGFRMYGFKIAECTKVAAHDWTECPFLHEGEKARRRDPRKHTYTATPCPDYRRGTCKRGDICTYAHGVFEAWLHPSKYRTQLCKDGLACGRKVCFFAHHLAELRAVESSASENDQHVESPTSSLHGFPQDSQATSNPPQSPVASNQGLQSHSSLLSPFSLNPTISESVEFNNDNIYNMLVAPNSPVSVSDNRRRSVDSENILNMAGCYSEPVNDAYILKMLGGQAMGNEVNNMVMNMMLQNQPVNNEVNDLLLALAELQIINQSSFGNNMGLNDSTMNMKQNNTQYNFGYNFRH